MRGSLVEEVVRTGGITLHLDVMRLLLLVLVEFEALERPHPVFVVA